MRGPPIRYRHARCVRRLLCGNLGYDEVALCLRNLGLEKVVRWNPAFSGDAASGSLILWEADNRAHTGYFLAPHAREILWKFRHKLDRRLLKVAMALAAPPAPAYLIEGRMSTEQVRKFARSLRAQNP